MSDPRRFFAPFTVGFVALSLLTACQTRMSHIPAIFQIAKDGAEVQPNTLVFPTRHGTQGSLTLSIEGLGLAPAAQRRLLAVLADVAYITIAVRDASGALYTQVLDKTKLNGGKATATFVGLAPGQAEVTLRAQDSAAKIIGQVSQIATVTASQTTTVDLLLTLDPNYIAPAGGGTSPTTGTIVTNATIVDGPTIFGTPQPAPSHAASTPLIYRYTSDIQTAAVGLNGNIFALVGDTSTLLELAHGGVPVATRTVGGSFTPGSATLFDQQSNLWIGAFDVQRLAPDLSPLSTAGPFSDAASRFRMDSQGNVWTIGPHLPGSKVIRKFAPDGTHSLDITYNGSYLPDMAFDSQERLWATCVTVANGVRRSSLVQFAPDGTFLKEIAVSTGDPAYKAIAIDKAGQIWFTRVAEAAVYVINPDGTPIMSIPTSKPLPCLKVDRNGTIWGYGTDYVAQFDSQGKALQHFDFNWMWIDDLLDTPNGMVGRSTTTHRCLVYLNP